MNIKSIKLNLKLGKLKLTPEYKRKMSAVIIKNRRLFFIIFFGAVTIYSFNVIFKKAYVEINYVQYPEQGVIGDSREKTMLEKIVQGIAQRKKNLETLGDKKYADPFSFRDDSISGQAGVVDTKNTENITGSPDIPAKTTAENSTETSVQTP